MSKLSLALAVVILAAGTFAAVRIGASLWATDTPSTANVPPASASPARSATTPQQREPAPRLTEVEIPDSYRSATVSAAGNPVLEHCLVTAKDDVQVPAQEDGVLVDLETERGKYVNEGDLVGQIDDTQPKMQQEVALRQYNVAKVEADDDINILYAQAASAVAKTAHKKALEANRSVAEVITQMEIERLKLDAHRAELQIRKSRLDQKIAEETVKVRTTEYHAAGTNIERRKIKSPLNGQIEDIHYHKGEFVKAGEPVMRIVGLEELRVEGFVNARDWDPSEIVGRDVTVTVDLARGRQAQFTGKITFVGATYQAGGDYRISADVTNRQENGQWLLRPGAVAQMEIDVK